MKCTALLAAALAAVTAPAEADVFAAKGAKGTLSVEYVYESSGKKADKNDSHEWRVKRSATLSADLVAQAPQTLPALTELEASQKADLKNKQEKAESAQKKMAPLTADMEKIMARCGENEACIEREVAAYGLAMGNNPAVESARKDVAEVSKQGPPRYQMWTATLQKGTFSIEESAHIVDADPICASLPGARGTRDETRKGGGDISLPPGMKPDPAAVAGPSEIEIDSTGKTTTAVLPVPLIPLPYVQTVKTDDPEEKSGTSRGSLRFPSVMPRTIRVALKGAGRDESGTEVMKTQGAAGEGGTLTVRWKWTAK
jgi:hypothetical protein